MLQNYVCHKNYSGKTMQANQIEIEQGESLERQGDVLFYKGEPVCIYRSLVGKQHFSANDDGCGLERGTLTWALAYEPRLCFGGDKEQGPQQRFTDDEIEVLLTKWQHFLKPDIDFILFNDSFFEQSPDILKEVAQSVGISVEG